MNLVFVGSSPRAWGSEQHFVGLAKACRAAGHRVVAVVRAGSEVETQLLENGVEVRATPFRGGADPRAMLTVIRTVSEIGADWLVTGHKKHYWPLYAVARLTGTKLAVFRHLIYVRDWLTRVIFPRLTDRFFVVSDFALEALVEAGAPRERLTRLYNQIDLQRFRPDERQRAQTRADLNLPADALVIGFVGRHEAGKGVHFLREALRQAMDAHPNLFAVWTGSGPEWLVTKREVYASDTGHRHRFIEWTRSPEKIYPAFDCLVAPSYAAETFGRVVAEAQACGVPVLATAAGGMRETFVAGESGELIESYEPFQLAQQILSLCADRRRRSTMSGVGRKFVRQFDSRLIAGAFIRSLTAASGSLLAITHLPLDAQFQAAIDFDDEDLVLENITMHAGSVAEDRLRAIAKRRQLRPTASRLPQQPPTSARA